MKVGLRCHVGLALRRVVFYFGLPRSGPFAVCQGGEEPGVGPRGEPSPEFLRQHVGLDLLKHELAFCVGLAQYVPYSALLCRSGGCCCFTCSKACSA